MTPQVFLEKSCQKLKTYKNNTEKWFGKLVNTLYYRIRYGGNYISVNCWVEQRCGHLYHRNFGDELNIYLMEAMTGKTVVSTQSVFQSSKPNYMVIGSILDSDTINSSSVVWGAGTMWGYDRSIKAKPQKVCAVRGKLTQRYLVSQGISCPDVYGDPALLMPLVYNPVVEKKYRIGVIPHVFDLDSPIVKRLTSLSTDLHVISFENYKDWHHVIDEIKSCDFIISSSLHGLILSDAYHIPNAWVKFSDKIHGGDYKYLDYFSGVNRNTSQVYIVKEEASFEDVCSLVKEYSPIEYDPSALLHACPFKINLAI